MTPPKRPRGGTPGNKGNPSPPKRVATGKAMVQVKGFKAPAGLAAWFNALEAGQKRAAIEFARDHS